MEKPHGVRLVTDGEHYVVGKVYVDKINLTGSWKYMGAYWIKVKE